MTVFEDRNLKEWRPRSKLKRPAEILDAYRLKCADVKFVAEAILQSLIMMNTDLCAFRHHFVSSANPHARKPSLCMEFVAARSVNCAHMHDKPVISHAMAFIVQNKLADPESCEMLTRYERNSYDGLRAADYYATN